MFQITDSAFNVFKYIKSFKKPTRAVVLFQACDKTITRAVFDASLKRLHEAKIIKKVEFGVYQVVETDETKFEISQRKTYSKKKKASQPQPQTVQPPQEINLSQTANKFADYASDLLKENNDLRALLLQVHTKIGKALSLDSQE